MTTTQTIEEEEVELAPAVERLTKDLRDHARRMGVGEVRYLVARYYQSQEDRKRSANQARATEAAEEPGAVVAWLAKQSLTLETRIKQLLDVYSEYNPLGVWARSNVGIGPVIASGLLAHVDLAKAPTAGHIWAYAGLDPRVIWKGAEDSGKLLADTLGGKPKIVTDALIQKACDLFRRRFDTLSKFAAADGKPTWTSLCKALARKPWNSDLKTLCWKIGESFVKVSNHEKSVYGRLYREYRAVEDARNEAGEFKTHAAAKLERFNIGKTTEAYGHYSSGHLPPAHLFSRAKRRVVKLFLSHYWHVGYELLHKRPAPRPWAIEHGGHTHFIPPPNYVCL